MTVDFAQARIRMVDGQVRTTDVTSLALIQAMLDVPREYFVPASWRDLAYIDEDIQIAPAADGRMARYLMEASPLARMLQAADVQPTDIVLDVGSGAGYAAAILSQLAGSVIALESDAPLAAQAGATLAALGCGNVTVVQGELAEGHPGNAPYDVIVVAGAVDFVPSALFHQLKEGGRLVVVEGHGNAGVANLYVKSGRDVTSRRVFNAAIKPLPGFESAPAFHF